MPSISTWINGNQTHRGMKAKLTGLKRMCQIFSLVLDGKATRSHA